MGKPILRSEALCLCLAMLGCRGDFTGNHWPVDIRSLHLTAAQAPSSLQELAGLPGLEGRETLVAGTSQGHVAALTSYVDCAGSCRRRQRSCAGGHHVDAVRTHARRCDKAVRGGMALDTLPYSRLNVQFSHRDHDQPGRCWGSLGPQQSG